MEILRDITENTVSFEDIHGDYVHSARIKMVHTCVISI